MLADALQDINQILVRGNPCQAATHDQRLEYSDVSRTLFGPAEHPVLPSHGDAQKATPQMIGVNGNSRIVEVNPKRFFPFVDIAQGFAQWITLHQIKTVKLLLIPVKELIYQRLGMLLTIFSFLFVVKLISSSTL
jgi:hypothetical protein